MLMTRKRIIIIGMAIVILTTGIFTATAQKIQQTTQHQIKNTTIHQKIKDAPTEQQSTGYQFKFIRKILEKMGNHTRLTYRIRHILLRINGYFRGGLSNLKELTGRLQYNDNQYTINNITLLFKPKWYVNKSISNNDFDQDGDMELVFEELQGLIDTNITVKGKMIQSSSLNVFYINDELFRTPWRPSWTTGSSEWRHCNGQQ